MPPEDGDEIQKLTDVTFDAAVRGPAWARSEVDAAVFGPFEKGDEVFLMMGFALAAWGRASTGERPSRCSRPWVVGVVEGTRGYGSRTALV